MFTPVRALSETSFDQHSDSSVTLVYTGGDLTFFKVERADGGALPYIDVLACGNGQYGGLGNSQYSNGQGTPVRTKNVSGLLECKFVI